MEDFNSDDYLEQRLKKSKPTYSFPKLKIAFVSIVIISFGLLGWYAYSKSGTIDDASLPLIEAKTSLIKSKPENPGGLVVANRDKDIFENMSNKKTKKAKVEKTITQPEAPASKESITKTVEKEIQSLPKVESKKEINPDFIVSKDPAKALTTEPNAEKENTVTESDNVNTPENKEHIIDDLDELDQELSKIDNKQETSTEQKELKSETVAKNYSIRIAALKTESSAIEAWESLKSDYQNILGNLSREIIKTEKDGKTTFYLHAGPISTQEKAEQICKQLQDAGRRCRVY